MRGHMLRAAAIFAPPALAATIGAPALGQTIDDLVPLPPLRLVGGAGGGGGSIARAPSGPFLGADTGWATMLGAAGAPATGAWSFGARAGYAFSSGLALDARFDDLGVHAPSGEGPLLLGTAGVRYSLPFIVMPFADAHFGAAWYGDHATPTAGLGLGLSFPVLRHLLVDVSARDWIADVDGSVRHVPTFELGIAGGFGGR
jgi:hypothetical protein